MLSVEDLRSFTTPGNGPITGMGSLDEEISAMLQSSHSTFSQASLAEVMAPDVFSSSFTSHASPYPRALPASNPHSGGLARTSSMSSAGLPNNSRPRPHPNSRISNQRPQNLSQKQWAPMTGDEKWMLDAKGEVLDMHSASNSPFSTGFESGFGMPMMNPPAPAAPPPSGGLHRYHSAPSAFLQALADEAFSQIPPPPPNANMFSEGGLTPITEVMDVERMGSGNSLNEFEQFLSPDSDFSRRAAMSALQAKADNAETYSNLFPPAKSTGLLRQKSLPVPQQNSIVPKQDPMEEHHSEDSISGTSEDNSLVSGFIVSGDALTSWPTSPGTPGSKRPRGSFPAWESETSSGGSAENPKSYRLNNNPNGLIRHMSLPTSTDPMEPPTPNPSSGDELNLVQMRARAKRGCATHPRSIAERVRRTRISERMKKLQDLVPNMEKTTNTSDMLDETVDYVKSLQLKVSELQETIVQLKAAAAAQNIKSP
ncbi:hypothetical protein KC19_8G019700 [Ceratodon purpureus]|uniref:BHLH domain-containing protein n=1 Tax=Ceratodon purpureus TaxID=3225 RepID=A0A8T0GUD9_CERPU|nr:hypothetical protein KC19_8G019700 [Ceratodon purpureus]